MGIDFNFDWLMQMFANFYEFFGGIARFLTLTPQVIVNQFDASAQNVVAYIFTNPFTQVTSYREFYCPTVFNWLMEFCVNKGWGSIPLWSLFLVNLVSLFVIVMSIRFIAELKDMIA